MNYPQEILPNITFKKIECSLTGYYLIRYTDSNDPSKLWDFDMGMLFPRQICSPKEHITDLSTSLLSIYNEKHVFIELLGAGINELCIECAPNAHVETPIYDVHFAINKDRGFWVVPVALLLNTVADYSRQAFPFSFKASCQVIHTPMKWNFWHFSIRWMLDSGEMIHSIDDSKRKKKILKLMAEETRAIIAKNARIQVPEYRIIDSELYSM